MAGSDETEGRTTERGPAAALARLRAPATAADVPRFDRRFLAGGEILSAIGQGAIGGKAAGLARAHEVLESRPEALRLPGLEIAVPSLAVIGADVFDAFIERNALRGIVREEPGDHHVARAFQSAALPAEIAGDLSALVGRVHVPLAVRSSSLLEDAIDHPLAGVYATKMTPNDAYDPDARFRRLAEAIKLVWASACFRGARAALRAIGVDPDAEKMAVIVQEVVGRRHADRFYPDVSAVARSYNFYPVGSSRADEGVVQLALGLGKTIVDGGKCWTYSPASPRAGAPFGSIDQQIEVSQSEFWAVRMGPPPVFDPIAEVEYLERHSLRIAESDGTLAWTASTFDPERDRLVPGTPVVGARVLDFAPLLGFGEWPFNDAVRALLARFEEALGAPVEIELALTLPEDDRPARLGFLQVRPMAISGEWVEVADAELESPRAVIASRRVLGNGVLGGIQDVVAVRRDHFASDRTRAIAEEIEALNRKLSEARRPYLLIGFGRWGSSEPWLGIPVAWPQIAGARAIVEAHTEALSAEMSQGAHFFHNLLGFGVPYFSVGARDGHIDWDWLEARTILEETPHVRHLRTERPLEIRVDGRSGRGVVTRPEEGADARA